MKNTLKVANIISQVTGYLKAINRTENPKNSAKIFNLKNIIMFLNKVESIEITEKISTAQLIFKNGKYHLKFSGSFIRNYLTTSSDITFVFLHEMFHFLEGDFFYCNKKSTFENLIFNIVADLIINRLLLKNYFFTPPEFLYRLYSPEQFPALLLRPPTNCSRHTIGKDSFSYLVKNWGDKIAREVADFYQGIWSGEFFTKDSIYIKLIKLLKMMQLYDKQSTFYLVNEILIGNHGGNGNNNGNGEWVNKLPDDIKDKLREKLRNNNGFEYSKSSSTYEVNLAKVTKVNGIAKLLSFFEEALEKDRGKLSDLTTSLPNPVIFPGRRECIFLMNDFATPFSQGMHVLEEGYFLNLYIDVSGSMEKKIPIIYSILSKFSQNISSPIYIFSNAVFPISFHQLKKGTVKTTYGTDFNCVLKHAIEHKFKNLILITDGIARIDSEWKEKVKEKGIKIYLILTEDEKRFRFYRAEIISVSHKSWEINLEG